MRSDILAATHTEGKGIDHSALDLTQNPAEQPCGTAYEDFYPYYAELCALSELRKMPGFGAELASGVGGHALLYLNGVRLDRSAGYPVLRLCTADEQPTNHGVGISVNSHYSNANWVAVEGRDFLWRGALAPGEYLSRDAYARTQAQAKAMGILDGVDFHREFFQDKPAGMSDRDYMYEISVATDYGAQFGRDSYRTRIPLDRARMGAMVDYLNAINVPYRAGECIYRWRLFNDNCVHVAYNALAAAGVWGPWPTGKFVPFALWLFPVPKNAFIDLLRRGNELPLEDAQGIYEDAHARRSLLATGTLPTAPGALASIVSAVAGNDIYDVTRLRLIFFDNFLWGPYRFHFKRMMATPHYTDLRENLRHFAARYAAAQAVRRPRRLRGERAVFQTHYEEHLANQSAIVAQQLARLEGAA
jgi:hypothetical protein